jgi:hypothetical protein
MRSRTKQLTAYLGVAATLATLLLGTSAQPAHADQAATIDAVATLFAGGTMVQLSGLFQSTAESPTVIEFTLQQAKGRRLTTAAGEGVFLAVNGITGWTAVASAPLGSSFATGPALVTAAFTNGLETVTVSAKVYLRK